MSEQELLRGLVNVIKEAGEIALEHAYTGFREPRLADSDIPFATADQEINSYLLIHLTELFPEAGWLSQQTADNPKRLQKEYVWIVDPIDGSYDFVRGSNEWVISIALVHNGQPYISAVYNPRKEHLYTAIKAEGAYLNGRPIFSSGDVNDPPILLYSRNSRKYRKMLTPLDPDHNIQPIGSLAYRLCLVASGEADATISFNAWKIHEWDIAAGTLILNEAGGAVYSKHLGADLRFNQEKIRFEGVVGVSEGYQSFPSNLRELL